jgi:hypothetical protein
VKKTIAVVALAAVAGTANAGGIGLRAGTTGIGADIGFGIVPTLGGRIGISGMNLNTDVDTTDVHYDAKAKILTGALLLDWSPLGPFRISGGFMPHKNRVELSGAPTAGSRFPAGTTLSGDVKPDKSFAPYLGIGWGNVWTKGVNFYFDLGVMFQGSPKVSLDVQCAATMTAGECTTARNEVEAERVRVEDKIDKYKYYPVANIGLTIGW